MDFPEDISLHLFRYDSLRNARRLPEAVAVVESIRSVDPESPYILGRLVEALASDPKRKDEAVSMFLTIAFAETEPSTWPVDYAWKAIQQAHLEQSAYLEALNHFRSGLRPTLRGFFVLASHAAGQGTNEKRVRQPIWRNWFPGAGASELSNLLETLDTVPWPKEGYRGILLKQLCDLGYARSVVRYWKRNRVAFEGDVESWAEVSRAFIKLKRKREAGKLLKPWRQRPGVPMWVVGNYMLCLSALRRKPLQEARSSCRDALVGLRHDHCAKYLAHREAEACALLGDHKAFGEIWSERRSYFDGKLADPEWFEPKLKYLLAKLPIMGRALDADDLSNYRRLAWGLRWRRLVLGTGVKKIRWRWWWLLWFWFAWQVIALLRHA